MTGQNLVPSADHVLLNEDFMFACRDYSYLVNHGYPERGAIKLVGDRYRLNRDQRTVLYRGISSEERSARRRSFLVHDIKNRSVAVDGYNVLFSLLNYRLGRFIFISTDNIMRDAGSLHGKFRDDITFADCVVLMVKFLASMQPASADIFLDSPVSHSERHAQVIHDLLAAHNLKGSCQVIRSADFALKHFPYERLATSDTVIIERAASPVIDLPRMILEQQYKAEFVKISELLLPCSKD
jgi:hypothetical protein